MHIKPRDLELNNKSERNKQIDEGLKKLLEESKIDYTIFPQETAIMDIIKYLEL